MKILVFLVLITQGLAQWPRYSKLFQEPEIDQLTETKADYYRLIVCPTFSEPYLFNFKTNGNDSGVFTVKMLSGKGGYGAGPLILEKQFIIEGEEFKRLLKKMRTRHSKTPLFDLPEETGDILTGVDGSQVLYEGVEGGETFQSNLFCPQFAHAAIQTAGLLKKPEYSSFHESLTPYFEACQALMQTARSRVRGTREMREDFRAFSFARVIHHSSSFRKAVAILDQVKEADENDPFATPEPLPATRKEHQKARLLLRQALTENPDSFIIHLELAKSYLESEKDFRSAEHHFSAAVKLDPQNEVLVFDRGAMFLEAGEIEKAEADLKTLTGLKAILAPGLQEAINRTKSKKK